jgi:DNA-binding Lrp family transcriptional regulator
MDKQGTFKKALDEIDQKVMKLLQTEAKELTLKEIAQKTGETPQTIAKALWRLCVQNEKLLTEKMFEFYL